MTSNNQVCVFVCSKNILNAEYKEDKIFVTKWKLCEEKHHSGAAKPRISTVLKTKLVTRHLYSHTLMQ
jgi:hypothetical protein